jgi:recombination protein RecR
MPNRILGSGTTADTRLSYSVCTSLEYRAFLVITQEYTATTIISAVTAPATIQNNLVTNVIFFRQYLQFSFKKTNCRIKNWFKNFNFADVPYDTTGEGMEYPSKLVEEAVNEIAKLPGIGKKTALRLALHLLKQDRKYTADLAEALVQLRDKSKHCRICHILSDSEDCTCDTARRDNSMICVVEDTPDAIAIRNTAQYNGFFHVLGGVISPMEGIGPSELNIESLIRRVGENGSHVQEVILALSPTMEGDTTAFYIARKLKPYNIQITVIARGIPIGGELEYADEVTLGRSISHRLRYDLDDI